MKSSKDVLVKGDFSCKYLLPNLEENIGFDIFINGIYERQTINFLQKIIPANGCFMDLGANIGAVLIPLCKRRSDIRVLAVEAAPWIYEYLKKNVSLNELSNVQILNNALFDQDDMELNFFSPFGQYGKGSFSPVFSKNAIKVITKKVDTIINDFGFQKVNVMKVDVEGFEYFVFKGAETLLQSGDAPDIVFEFVDWAERQAMGLFPGQAQKLLLDFGYKIFVLEDDTPVRIDNLLDSGSHNLFATKHI